jgi:hypothetical protein
MSEILYIYAAILIITFAALIFIDEEHLADFFAAIV